MASFVTIICTKNYQNLIVGFQVTAKNVGDAFLGTQCINNSAHWYNQQEKGVHEL